MTSIEKVFELLEKKGDMRETPSIRNLQLNIDTSDYLEIKRQAKEMHKQEIENTYWDGGQDIPMSEKSCEQYYQKTFVSKGSDEVELPKHQTVISENGNELLFDKEGNLIKELPKQETLYTEEQVDKTISWVKDYFESLKQPKKD
jgi:hypothetical protein